MSTLNDKQINQAYKGLVHTSDHDVIGATQKRLQDGEGNNMPVEVGTAGMTWYGTQDFTNATVTGISGGGGGTSGTSGVDGTSGTSGTSGGGAAGASMESTVRGLDIQQGGGTTLYKMNYGSTTYGTGTVSIGGNTLYITPICFAPSETITEIASEITTVGTELVHYVLYGSALTAGGQITPNNLVHDFGTIDPTTTGIKAITGSYPLDPNECVDNVWFIGWWSPAGFGVRGATTTGVFNQNNWGSFGATQYRSCGFSTSEASIPTNISSKPWYTWVSTNNFAYIGTR